MRIPEEIEPDASGDARVLRGGSWYGNPDAVRCAERNWNDPGERVDNAGFRLVSSGPIRYSDPLLPICWPVRCDFQGSVSRAVAGNAGSSSTPALWGQGSTGTAAHKRP